MRGTLQESVRQIRFAGLELSGAHSAKSCITVLDHYPESGRLFLSEIHSGLGRESEANSDEVLTLMLNSLDLAGQKDFEFYGLSTQAPTSLPPEFRNDKQAERETSWLNDFWHKTKPQPRRFLSYLNRPFEIWMRYFTPEKFKTPESLGSNLAPLAARLQFLSKDLKIPLYESFPRACFHRINAAAQLRPSWAQNYSDLDRGIQIREKFIAALCEKIPNLFIYDHDLEILIFELQAFHSFLSSLSLYFNSKEQCDPRPENFPKQSVWGILPKQHIQWDKL